MRESLLAHLTTPDSTAQDLRLHAFEHQGDHVTEGVLVANDGSWWWIAGGVPRLLPAGSYRRPDLEDTHASRLRSLDLAPAPDGRLSSIEERTIDRFGAEWIEFREWGFHDRAPAGAELEFQGGLWKNTLRAFQSKSFLGGQLDDKLVLDAGCGNGRFTAAALSSGAAEVIGVDIGWGVDVSFDRHRDDPRVHVVQASLFDLPIRSVDAAFSIGVLMHTGDAWRAFERIAMTVKPGGLFAVRMYHKGNAVYELTDRGIRAVTARLGKRHQGWVARAGSRLGRAVVALDGGKPMGALRRRMYRLVRTWPTVHHNLDWWSAPIATHHTAPEVAEWGDAVGLRVRQSDLSTDRRDYGFWSWPEALTILFERPSAAAAMVDAA